MPRCRRESNPDLICVSYRVASNRSTRLLLLEIVAEQLLREHGDDCNCDGCIKAREAFTIKARL